MVHNRNNESAHSNKQPQHPLLVTEAPLNSLKNREKAAEVLFEQHHVPALFFSVQAVLSLYAAGTTTGMMPYFSGGCTLSTLLTSIFYLSGVVLDVGDGVAHSCPVYEGFVIQGGVKRSDIAGRDVTRDLQHRLRLAGHSFTTSAEFELVRQIKEKCCYVSYAISKDEEMVRTGKFVTMEHRLPDGTKMQLGPEMFRSTELLFDPKLVHSEELGVADLLASSIKLVCWCWESYAKKKN